MKSQLTLLAFFVSLLTLLQVHAYPIPTKLRSQLICAPATLETIIKFFVFNYFAHAMTVKQIPGETMQQTTWSILYALLLPFSGIATGCKLIQRGRMPGESDLQHAARAEAICAVVRTDDWKPLAGESIGAWVPNRISNSGRNTPIQWSLYTGANQIWGLFSSLAIVRGMTPIAPRYGGNVKLSKSHNILKCMASIVQVIYACFTLYRTRYDQIDRYGYAAYGLTVIPYAIMSLLNLAANIVTLDYPCLYMVRSEVMDEAERRGAKFEGTVGVIEPGPESDEHRTFHFETDAEVDGTNVSVHFTDPSSPGEDDVRFVRRDEEDPRIFVPRQGRYGSGEKCTWIYIREMLGRSLKIVALIALHLIINGLTKFDDGDSTAIQRGWTMAWLLFGQAYSLVGIFIENPMYIFLGSSYDLRKDPEEDWKLKQVVGYISFRILYGAPAVGGMVTVMQMMKQYGSCTVL